MRPRRLREWERTWLLEFADSDAFARGYVHALVVVAIGPLFLACGVELLLAGAAGACLLLGGIAAAAMALSAARLRMVLRQAGRTYRTARPRDGADPTVGPRRTA